MGKEQGQGIGIGVLDAMRTDITNSEGKKKCGGVKERLRQVGTCRRLHRGDWSDRGMWCDGKGVGGRGDRVWCAMKEG